jgi:hypothetical protein
VRLNGKEEKKKKKLPSKMVSSLVKMDEVHTMDGFIQISKLWGKVMREGGPQPTNTPTPTPPLTRLLE